MNLPGTKEYEYQWPWVSKQRVDQMLAADLIIYVDNEWPIRYTKKLCWEASMRWSSACSWLDIQEASRKFEPPLQALRP